MWDKWNGAKFLGITALSALGSVYFARKAVDYVSDLVIYPLITDRYEENLWEMKTSSQRFALDDLIETELRAHTDSFIERPIGGPRKFKYLEKIMFNAAQLDTLPTERDTSIDTAVVIGPRARKPLHLDIPLLVGGMAYGLALTEAYKIAIARGATAAGTCTNTGLGPFLESEREAAEKLIIQYSRMEWNREESILRQADAIEIQFGHGANAGVGKTKRSREIKGELRKRFGLRQGQDAVIYNRIEGITGTKELRSLVEYLRELTGGVPVGVKIAAGKYLEKDLEIITGAGVDFVSVDGAEGGTHGSLPILEDEFGLPTFMAAARATRFWEEHQLKGKVSLLVGGELTTPGDCLKVLALGADAVYLGTAVLIAVTHTQLLKVFPFEPPPQLSYESGKKKGKFNIDKGARSLARFFNATVYEIEEAVKALGKDAVREVSRDDIFAIDRDVADLAGIELGFYPPRQPLN